MGLIITEGFVQLDLPATGGVFQAMIAIYMASFAIKTVLSFIKSLPGL